MSGRRQEPARETLFIENITVPAQRARGLDEASVTRLTESMGRIGLHTPISVRMDGEDLVLVAGRHRLEAARRLGWERIDAIYIDGDEADARLWEISENLHRAELSAVERAEHIDEWRRLTVEKGAQVAPPSGGKQPGDRGHYKTAEALGVSRDTVRRAERIASLPDEVRDQARAEDWSQSRLLDEARQRDPVRTAKPVPPPPPVRNDAEAEDAWLGAILRLWNKAPREWRERFLEQVETPVMDRAR